MKRIRTRPPTMNPRKSYTLKTPRFDPFKNTYIGEHNLIKICSKCGGRHPLSSDYYQKDGQREYGYKSQCKLCQRKDNLKYYRDYYSKAALAKGAESGK